jgi:hypothetical protein
MVRLTARALQELREGEALVLDWHRFAICCAAAGEISLHTSPRARIERSGAFRRVSADVYVHRQALPHLGGREVEIDCRRRLGLRRFVSDLPQDFGLRSCLGRAPGP